MPLRKHNEILDDLYRDINHRRYVHPDPLEFLYPYRDPADREIVALVASSMAYGRVAQILQSVSEALERIGPSPAEYLAESTPAKIRRTMRGFKHRFNTGDHVAAMLIGTRNVIKKHGSLGDCFACGVSDGDSTVLDALIAFVGEITDAAGADCGHLLPDPARGSACKRLCLMLRWLVRKDRVDPGGWNAISASKLLIPLDTHMHKIAFGLGATKRKAADMRTVVEVTEAFRKVAPEDPVRYDFSLTRLGIRNDMDVGEFLALCNNRDQANA
ncbi:MAG: TIGR02757 family protein [Phycisphaerae bacterium]|jgi:uncharacterized protein (TIGR02757 family)|nr:TIGR02757 family protein [Phycisphaerae bacterium]|tara:strand:+ start:28 stop:843 length:816 start_codon:yes stop_codon:yes gene_type:complete